MPEILDPGKHPRFSPRRCFATPKFHHTPHMKLGTKVLEHLTLTVRCALPPFHLGDHESTNRGRPYQFPRTTKDLT